MNLCSLKCRGVAKWLLAFFVMVAVGFLCTQDTFADCDGYGAACNCGAPQCGAAWLNGSSYGDGANGLTVERSVGDDNQVITGYIHGAILNVSGGTPSECSGAPEGYCENTARHVYLVDSEWPGKFNDEIGYGEWPTDDSGYGTRDWAEQHKLWWYSTDTVDYETEVGGGWYNRGRLMYGEDSWSIDWESNPMQIRMRLNDFLGSGGVRDVGNYTYEKDVYIFRCYYSYRGCSTDMTTIRIHVEPIVIKGRHDNWRVEYQGKISLKNDDNSPLYEYGRMLSSNSWPDASGWEDDSAYTYPSLYTPKESGQKLRTMYQLRWKCNNWDDIGCGYKYHWLAYYGTDFPYSPLNGSVLRNAGQFWTRYAYSSEVGLNNRQTSGSGTFSTGGRSYNDAREVVSPQRTKTISSIPYGTAQGYNEQLQYTNIGMNHKDVEETLIYRTCCGGDPTSCWTCVTNYIEVSNTNEPDNGLNASRNMHVNVHNPYNFTTTVSSNISGGNGSTILGGSTINLNLSANIKSRTDTTAFEQVGFPYFTKVPDDTEGNNPTVATAVSFILKPEVDINSANLSTLLKDRTDVIKSAVPDNNLCNYLKNAFGDNLLEDGRNDCHELFTEDHNSINSNLGDTGWDTSKNNNVAQNGVSAIKNENKNFTVAVPDIEDGHKYCTVIGINHADSGGKDGGYRYVSNYNDTFHLPAYSINDNWHLSNISCRTIAKVPSFQTWGNIYTSGGISTTTVKKIPDADIKTPAESQKYLFGSWSETFSLANKDIKNFGTGASLGYLNNNLGGLPIADSNNKMNYCNIVNMTIANTRCNSGIGGNAGNIVVSNEDFLNKFVAHYATTTTEQLDRVTDTVSYYKAKGNATFNDTSALADNGYRLGNGVISLNNNTLIYQVDGNLTINHNVCTGYPTERDQCNNGTNDHYIYNFYNLDNANVPYNASSDKIPQIIIIASGDINIDKSVTEIDAWLYSGGTIKTCYNGNLGDDSCGEPLIVHGPVFAKNLELHRTYGSAGARRWEGNFDNDSRFFYSGAATPAEIFELRSDVYQWIYQQTSTDNKNANVRYMRELSPRY